jgi:Sulfotransferase family
MHLLRNSYDISERKASDLTLELGANQRTFSEAVRGLVERWPNLLDSAPTDAPVFVFSAGWRSGSTLLQRMLMPECFVWGEPYGHSGMLQGLADPLRCMTRDWPEPHFFYDDTSATQVERDNGKLTTADHDVYELSERFVANLYPSVASLLAAHRAYFESLLIEPARQAGAKQWGFKEVRLSADYAYYLKLLYPNSKFLFLIRNPYDAYRSWAARRNAGWKWHYRWPDKPVTAQLFGQLWQELTNSFLAEAITLDAHVVRYEELKNKQFESIESHLGFALNRRAANIRPSDGPTPIETIPNAEFDALGSELHTLAESLGYSSDFEKARMTSSCVASENRETSDVAERDPTRQARSTDRNLEPTRCVVLVPIGGQVVPACEEALTELERRGYTVRRVRGYSAIDQGRNQMATNALADGFEETMWIDLDVGFDPDDVERLRRHGVPIVCGIYPQKGRRVLACHVLPGTEKLIFGDDGGLAEILYAGTGFLLVRREAYETIHRKLQLPLCNERFGGRPMVPYFQPMSHADESGHWYLAEDFAFCERARQAGFNIYADTSVRLMHYGNYGYSWEDAGMELQRFRTFHFHTK